MYRKRKIENSIKEVADSFPCVAIYGSRQVGKSTTVNHIFGDTIKKVTLDDGNDRALAKQNPKLFLETHGWPLIIDEIQKAPELLYEIKIVIDDKKLEWTENDEDQQLMYILTGSSRFEIQQGISDSLAGRCGVIETASFSQVEKYDIQGSLFDPDIQVLLKKEKEGKITYRTRAQIFEDIFVGGMPDVVLGKSKRDIYFRSYLDTYIEKDVKKLISEDSETVFRNFISLVALRTSAELRYDTLANDVGIDVRICKRWISILETAGIIYLIHPYLPNISNRIIKAPKMYFMDTGLCAYLCKWPDAQMLENGAMGGAFYETFVVSELIKNFYAYNLDPKEYLFYYRDKDQEE
ncbi:ATP-binding protein [Butyrivibrio sp. JL13D10]|uniref:ATP-binding protein n=1 Tax=Butyrivibrio sp. JL13D10 TaxID=3236815 RepID=UPI0038B67EC4